jgi:hypothetical protein
MANLLLPVAEKPPDPGACMEYRLHHSTEVEEVREMWELRVNSVTRFLVPKLVSRDTTICFVYQMFRRIVSLHHRICQLLHLPLLSLRYLNVAPHMGLTKLIWPLVLALA